MNLNTATELKRVPLHDRHVAAGAKMVEFAGYAMPLQYTGIVEEHLNTRSRGGIFDASHMGQVEISGPKALEQVQWLTINDASRLEDRQCQYSALCNPEGRLLDDIIVTRFGDRFLIVVNASNIDKDFNWMINNRIEGAEIINRSDEFALLAVQGSQAQETLQPLTQMALEALPSFHAADGQMAGLPAIISRTGYTGEAVGFEILVPSADAPVFFDALMEQAARTGMTLAGLGARDTLRLEKKYCLYGNDIDETTTPLEAGLGWIMKLNKKGFIGQTALLRQKEQGVARKLVGFAVDDKRIPRHGHEIRVHGEPAGIVTSGGWSPCLSRAIGMGYVPVEASMPGTVIDILVRTHAVPATVVETPFWK